MKYITNKYDLMEYIRDVKVSLDEIERYIDYGYVDIEELDTIDRCADNMEELIKDFRKLTKGCFYGKF